MELTGVGPAARPAWEEAAGGEELAVSQTPAWLDACCESSGREDVTRLYRAPDGRRLVLPLVRARRRPGPLAVEESLPFGWANGGLLCADGALRAGDVEAVLADLTERSLLRVGVRPGPEAEPLWAPEAVGRAMRLPRATQVLDLEGGFDAVWTGRFSSKVRRWARKAERGPLVVESGAGERLVPAFAHLYRLSVARWARQQNEHPGLARWRAARRDPPHKFAVVARRLGTGCRTWVAWRDGAPAAAIIVLRHGARATYWRGAMDKDLVAGTGANELLHRLAVEDACTTGARSYDLGDSTPGSSLARFKASFGAVERPHAEYRVERLPLTAAEARARALAKRALGFRDA